MRNSVGPHVNPSKLFALVSNYRRRGYTASFGVDVDPKRRQK